METRVSDPNFREFICLMTLWRGLFLAGGLQNVHDWRLGETPRMLSLYPPAFFGAQSQQAIFISESRRSMSPFCVEIIQHLAKLGAVEDTVSIDIEAGK